MFFSALDPTLIAKIAKMPISIKKPPTIQSKIFMSEILGRLIYLNGRFQT